MAQEICSMCGKTTTQVFYRFYKYDNGETFRTSVCANCADLHSKLVGA